MGQVIRDYRLDPMEISKILALPLKIVEGAHEIRQLAEYFEFDEASTYYVEAVEALGLIEMKQGRCCITELGELYVDLSAPQRNELVCRLLFKLPIINKILIELILKPTKSLSKNEIAEIIRTQSPLSGASLGRHAGTILAWFKWIQKNVGVLQVEGNRVFLPTY